MEETKGNSHRKSRFYFGWLWKVKFKISHIFWTEYRKALVYTLYNITMQSRIGVFMVHLSQMPPSKPLGKFMLEIYILKPKFKLKI